MTEIATKAAHTPGPWSFSVESALGGPTIKSGPRSWIADIRTCAGVRVGGQLDPETEANAKLIAAAPDLLAACQAAYATHNLTESEPGLPTLTEVGHLLKAALAKATS